MYHIYVSFKTTVDRKIRFGGSLSAKKYYPYKAWRWNLSAISPARNQERIKLYSLLREYSVHVRTYAYAYCWNLEKYTAFFIS